MGIFKKVFAVLGILFASIGICFAEQASVDFQFTVPTYAIITPVTSPVLIANITDRTGNLQSPLQSKFRVIQNSGETKTLYLKSNIVTQGGYEESMFIRGNQVYVAFGNLSKIPSSSSLMNCKLGGLPKDSPGVVAYPVTSIIGAEHKFIPAKNKYEIYAESGASLITINIGSNVLKDSYAGNDQKGYYQAILSLTEADI